MGCKIIDFQARGPVSFSDAFSIGCANSPRGQDHETCWTMNDLIPMPHSVALCPVLPLDVLEAIIDRANDNTASLRNLSLTCSAFLPRARYHLFHGIVVQTVQHLESSREFLDSRPWLPTLVQRATLHLTAGSKFDVLGVVPVHLISRLPNLRVWRMESDYFQPPRLSLHRLTTSCLRRYGSGVQDLELSNIFFEHMSDYTGLVSAFTCLQRLTCLNISLPIVDEDYVNSSVLGPETNVRRFAQPPRIRHLHVSS